MAMALESRFSTRSTPSAPISAGTAWPQCAHARQKTPVHCAGARPSECTPPRASGNSWLESGPHGSAAHGGIAHRERIAAEDQRVESCQPARPSAGR